MEKIQRLALINQYKILAKLDENNRKQYEEYIEILESGYKVFYDSLTDWISDEMSEDNGNFVLDVLDLYSAVESYKQHKGELEGLQNTIFRGFDGNREFKDMEFTRFLIFKQNKFTELKKYASETDNFNSHGIMRHIYEPIVKRWKESLGSAWPTERKDFEAIFG